MNGLKSRIICREHDSSNTDWSGNYDLLCKAKEINSPFGDINTYNASTLEDLMELQENGRYSAGDMSLESPWTLEDLERLTGMEDTLYDCIILYGTDGEGAAGKLAFTAEFTTRPGDATDEHLVLTTRVLPKSQPVWLNSKYDAKVTYDEFGEIDTITVTAASKG
jgi:hypothetical protein